MSPSSCDRVGQRIWWWIIELLVACPPPTMRSLIHDTPALPPVSAI